MGNLEPGIIRLLGKRGKGGDYSGMGGNRATSANEGNEKSWQ